MGIVIAYQPCAMPARHRLQLVISLSSFFCLCFKLRYVGGPGDLAGDGVQQRKGTGGRAAWATPSRAHVYGATQPANRATASLLRQLVFNPPLPCCHALRSHLGSRDFIVRVLQPPLRAGKKPAATAAAVGSPNGESGAAGLSSRAGAG